MRSPSDQLPAVIIGAGAAGLMAAIHAGAGPRPVLLLDGNSRPGQKILISGGGRCNVLPSQAAHTDFTSDSSPNLLRKILAAWPLADVRRFFEADLGVPLRLEPETGKLFPASNRANSVLDALLAAAAQRGGRLRADARVASLAREGEAWAVRLASGEAIAASCVILATGGLSAPTTGSDGAGLHMAQALGHTIVPVYPALVPLTGGNPAHRALAGVSLPVRLTAQTSNSASALTSTGGFLFTHRGYSGPAVLNISHVAARGHIPGPEALAGHLATTHRPPEGSIPGASIWVQWTALGAAEWDALLRTGRPLLALLREQLPERLAAQLLVEAGLAEVEGAQLRREQRQRLVETLAHYPLPYTGHEGYKTAEVTGGGIPLSEINPATMESRIAPGLYLCGEMLDAFGPIGGYNFLWAWITGRIAGESQTWPISRSSAPA